MTKDNYISSLSEKLTEIPAEGIQILPALRLLLSYNKRYTQSNSSQETALSEKVFALYNSAILAYFAHDEKTLSSLSAQMLALCEKDIVQAYELGGSPEDGLYNVHTLVTGIEANDVKENIRSARKIADFSFATIDLKREYLDAKESAEFNARALGDPVIFGQLLSKVKGMSEDAFRDRLSLLAQAENRALFAHEEKYFPRVVEEMVKEDIRLSSSANQIRVK